MKRFYIVEEVKAYRGIWVEAEDGETAMDNYNHGMYDDLFEREEFILQSGLPEIYIDDEDDI